MHARLDVEDEVPAVVRGQRARALRSDVNLDTCQGFTGLGIGHHTGELTCLGLGRRYEQEKQTDCSRCKCAFSHGPLLWAQNASTRRKPTFARSSVGTISNC